MKIELAKTAGFCMGVRRAMNMALTAARESPGPIYTLGPLIHNPQVVSLLERRGVRVAEGDLESGRTVIVRAHGIPPERRRALKASGARLLDATCPHVARLQATVRKHARAGREVVIVGDRGHAEVAGLMGFAEGHGHLVERPEDVDRLPEMAKACIVAQTTQDPRRFQEAADRLGAKCGDCVVCDTVCDSTIRRQREARAMAERVDAMVVVGGANSANTQRLADVCRAVLPKTYLVESADELHGGMFAGCGTVGITAGASTPNWVITDVLNRARGIAVQDRRVVRGLRAALNLLVGSNAAAAAGGAAMTYAACILLKTAPGVFPFISGLYLFSMLTVSGLVEGQGRALIDSTWESLYVRRRSLMAALALAGAIACVGLSAAMGVEAFLVAAGCCVLGALYNTRVPSGFLRVWSRYRSLRDIPGSKDLFGALAWAATGVVLPTIVSGYPYDSRFRAVFCLVFVFALARFFLYDVRDMQGDRIIGRETIPILIGKSRTKVVLTVLLGLSVLASVFWSYTGVLPPAGYGVLVGIACVCAYLYLYHRRVIFQGTALEVVVESASLLTAGSVAAADRWLG